MLKSIGFLIVLWGLSSFFVSFEAFDNALVAVFGVVEVGADETRKNIEERGIEMVELSPSLE